MKKSFLRVGMMLLMASVTLTSCQGFWDDLFGVESTPSTPSTPSEPDEPKDDKVVTEATVEDLADITAALNDVKDEIEETAKNGGEYEIAIKSEESLESTAADNTIEVPRVEDSNINLNFTNGVSTEQTLTVKAADAKSETPTEAVNKLTITMPESKDLNLELDMPETTVTLKAASGTVVYDEVVATTALNTLYIEKGVTVKNLQVKGGSVVVNGGTAETLVYEAATNDDVLFVYEDSTTVGVADRSEEHAIIKNCHLKNLKVINGNADYANVTLWCWDSPIEKLTITEGVVVKTRGNEPAVRIIEAEGEGAEFMYPSQRSHMQFSQNLKGVTVSADRSGYSEGTLMYLDMAPYNMENCTLKFDDIQLGNSFNHPELQTGIGSVKNCKFEATSLAIDVPRQSETIQSLKIDFTNCDFKDGFGFNTTLSTEDYVLKDGEYVKDTYWAYVDSKGNEHKGIKDKSEIPDDAKSYYSYEVYRTTETIYENYDVTFIFNSCNVGSAPLSKYLKSIRRPEKIPAGVNLKYVIDKRTYQFVEDSLEEVQ